MLHSSCKNLKISLENGSSQNYSRERQRETERERGRETERDRETERETERQRERERERDRDRQTDRQTEKKEDLHKMENVQLKCIYNLGIAKHCTKREFLRLFQKILLVFCKACTL